MDLAQVEEHEEEWDSVTKLHQDMSDAVNILVHCQPDPVTGTSVDGCGAPSTLVAPRCGLESAVRGSR